MPQLLELTKERKKKLRKVQEKVELFLKLLRELSNPATFKLYASGKAAIVKGGKGIPAEDLLNALHLR